PGVVELEAVGRGPRRVGDVGTEDPAHVVSAAPLEDSRHPTPGLTEDLRVAVPADPIAVHLGERPQVDVEVDAGHILGPTADVLVVDAGGYVTDALRVGLPTYQWLAPAGSGRGREVGEELVIPVGEPVDDVEAPPEVGLQFENRLHPAPYPAISEGSQHHSLCELWQMLAVSLRSGQSLVVRLPGRRSRLRVERLSDKHHQR